MRRDHFGTGNGRVSIEVASPEIIVGRRFRMTVTYAAGPGGVAVGGGVRFRLPGFRVDDYGERPPVRCSNPDVRLVCTNTLPERDGKNGAEFFTIDYLFVTLDGAPLKPGDRIAVDYGHHIGAKHVFAPQCAQRWAVEAAVDPDGSRRAPGSGFHLVTDPPVLTFVSDRAVALEVTIPSTTVAGEPFDTVVRARDRYRNIAAGYRGTITLRGQPYTFTPADEGVHRFNDTALADPGVHRLTVTDEALGVSARSNPTKVFRKAPTTAVYWGDTHSHSTVSADTAASNDRRPRPAGVYEYARDRADLDFCMVSDHSQDLTAEDWRETQRAAADACEPGRFVAFSAFEATHQPQRKDGDKNVYFFTDDEPYVSEGTTAEMYDDLGRRGSPVMVIPHLHGRTNWQLHDPGLERVVEVYAHWGCGLAPDFEPPMIVPLEPENCVSHALEQGHRLGFIASADHSGGHPGDDFWWRLSSYDGGLAAVYAADLTREGIWAGLWNRRCYGTTRARILLAFEINGHDMGSELIAAGAREISVNAYGTAGIETVMVIKNGRVLESVAGDGRLDVEAAFTDDAPERDTDYYYAHVVQVDGEQAWASPIWVASAT